MNTLNFEFTIDQTNALLNMLDAPQNSSTMQRAAFINLVQEQAVPQIKAIQIAEAKAMAEKEGTNESTTASD